MLKLLSAALCLVVAAYVSPAHATDEMQQITLHVTDGDTAVVDVACTLTNKFGSWEINAPGSVSVHRGADGIVIDCKKDGSSGLQVLKPKPVGHWCWDIAKCGGFGLVLDDRSGVGYAYPDMAHVELHASTGKPKR